MGNSRWRRPHYLTLSAVITIFVALSAIVVVFLFPTLPRVIIMATGPTGSAYSEFDRRYEEILARQGIHLAQNGIDDGNAELLPLAPDVAAARLAEGSIDVAMILTSFDAPAIQQLLRAPDISLMSLTRVDAYTALYPFMSKLILPAGAVDLAHNRPPADVEMAAVKTSLVVRRNLSPAVQYLLLDAATEIHSPPGLFHKASEFPAAEAIDLPLSENARRFYKSGMPFLQHYLPLWLAVLTERTAILLIPLAGVAYPLLRGVPAIFAWGVQRRIYLLYGELKLIELRLEDHNDERRSGALSAELSSLEDRASRLRVPVSYAHMLYTLRHNIKLVRARLDQG